MEKIIAQDVHQSKHAALNQPKLLEVCQDLKLSKGAAWLAVEVQIMIIPLRLEFPLQQVKSNAKAVLALQKSLHPVI